MTGIVALFQKSWHIGRCTRKVLTFFEVATRSFLIVMSDHTDIIAVL